MIGIPLLKIFFFPKNNKSPKLKNREKSINIQNVMDWSMGNIDLSFRMNFQVVSWVVHEYANFFFQKINKSENKK